MEITKNRKSKREVENLVEHAFEGAKAKSVVELTEGMCNVAYAITLEDGRKVILKIAPAQSRGLLSCEKNLMGAEVKAMELVRQHTSLPVPEVYDYEESLTRCNSPYFFMEWMPGENFIHQKEHLKPEEVDQIYLETGRAQYQLTKVQGEKFGLLGDKKHWKDSWFEAFKQLNEGVLKDALAKQVELPCDSQEVLSLLEKDREVFDEVLIPSLVHWDMWEGNLFVLEGHLSGIIDWERAMWADPFMDYLFRRHAQNSKFFEGYGIKKFTKEERRRMAWYDCYLYLIMMTEGTYREYPDDSQYQWAKPLFIESYQELKKHSLHNS